MDPFTRDIVDIKKKCCSQVENQENNWFSKCTENNTENFYTRTKTRNQKKNEQPSECLVMRNLSLSTIDALQFIRPNNKK